jgi:hypothetical protein
MSDMNETNVTVETEEKPNLFTQEDVSRVVAKNVKEERAKLLKEFGIENVEDLGKTKEALKAYKEMQEAQKSELDKIKEEREALANEAATYKNQLKAIETERNVTKVLGEMNIDSQYHKTILKLIPEVPEDEKALKELVTSTIKEFLPGVIEVKDIGFEPKPKKPESGTKQYLNDKYKNNPFFKG